MKITYTKVGDYLMTDYLSSANIDRINASTFFVSVASTPSVNITDENIIPQEYRIAQPDKIDKCAIKTALRTGITVSGAEIIYAKGVRIRYFYQVKMYAFVCIIFSYVAESILPYPKN